MTTNTSGYMIGSTSAELVYLEDIADNMPYPNSLFSEFSSYVELASGQSKGLGLPQATWSFGMLTQEQRDALRAYCPGTSASIAIRTRINDDIDYLVFTGIMYWPQDQERYDAGRYLETSMLFKFLTLIPGLY